MADYSPDKKSGCVAMIYGGLFRQRCFWPRRSASTSSIPTHGNNGIQSINSKRRRGSDERAFLDDTNLSEYPQRNDQSPMMNVATKTPPPSYQEHGRKVSNAPIVNSKVGLSNDHQSNGLVRASSSNVMLFGNLGNLRQPAGHGTSNPRVSNSSVLDYLPMTASEMGLNSNGNYGNAYGTNGGNGNGNVNYNAYNNIGNVKVSRNNVKEKDNEEAEEDAGPLCRALSTRLDPETLKAMGNEEYKQGNFAEALAFYDRAIGLDPDMASYRSNKSAALTGLGRLLEAVFECREAIKIDPTYRRAHYRLATLCLRLGEAEKSLYHYKQSGHEADPSDISKAKNLQIYLSKCTEARKLRDWQTVIKESSSAISSGADSALQVFALKAESLLKLHRHEDADAELSKAPRFGIDDCTKFFGPVGNANLLVTRAQVDVALGRFEEAVATAQRAAQLDSTNKDVNSTLRKAQALASARSNGNELFKASKFLDACVAYSEGLEQDFFNSVLLCNRAACRSKLGQFEKAVEDCSKALNVRPSYSKARLRRADCNAKLGRWEASAQDYEILRNKMPSDEEVARGLLEAQAHLKKSHSEQRQTQPDGHHSKNAKSDSNLAVVKDADHFRHFVTSPGISVVLFCNKSSDQKALVLMEQLSKRNQSLSFIKVEVEEHPILAKSEGVNSIPVFRMYKNGSRIKEIPRTSLELLESTVKFYTKS
ncbi:inactive TPR repeat-containing thioredoxin TTL3-like isoform X1 [Papaver somniferum]|uniref:inactive TPR repeat-containing thioredoxin TTL3-like isoform X1 n=1 Tax=Papaver somniferum TaxID=3469 RepID=UPI000E6FDBD8|nr:inactive TPR repeat-containing thioredoxin TTL3-like isoform X1 [Papaver somniferum]